MVQQNYLGVLHSAGAQQPLGFPLDTLSINQTSAPAMQGIHSYIPTTAGNSQHPHAPLTGAQAMNHSDSRAVGDDAAATVNSALGNPDPALSNKHPSGGQFAPSSLNKSAQPFASSHASLEPPLNNSAAFPFISPRDSVFAQQAQDTPHGAPAACHLALQSIMHSQGASQAPNLAPQAPGGMPQNMFMHVVPNMPGSYPGHFNAQVQPQSFGGMQPMVTAMVPTHLMQTMMPLVNTPAVGIQAMPWATNMGTTVPIHARSQSPVAAAHVSGSPQHGGFQPLDHAAGVDRGGGHMDPQTIWRPSATSEAPPGALHSPRGPGAAAVASVGMMVSQGLSGRTREASAGPFPGSPLLPAPHSSQT